MTEIMTTPATILSIDKLCQILGNNTVVLNEIIFIISNRTIKNQCKSIFSWIVGTDGNTRNHVF